MTTKIKVSISSDGMGTYNTRIEWPNGKQERKSIGYSLFGRAIAINKRLDMQFSDGEHDFYLNEKQYDKFCKNLIEYN